MKQVIKTIKQRVKQQGMTSKSTVVKRRPETHFFFIMKYQNLEVLVVVIVFYV